ncbi:MAG: macrocin O-methyltransferase [Chlorobi bacterium]|nr:macrocin O-methyltransferase [Chlorobiota bacterium]
MKKIILRFIKRLGYKVQKINSVEFFPDMEDDFFKLAEKCKPFTMTSTERLYSLYKSVEYSIKNKIDGDYVECGVWKGGSSMMIALTLLKNNITDKKIYLYDTYEGMSEPTEDDINYVNKKAKEKYSLTMNKETGSNWCRSELEEVKSNLYSTGYPKENIIFIKGKVEETIPQTVPQKISLLRLDTDWYESTKHEMDYLYPLLSEKGVLIIDDYGHWQGCRKAIDEYFKENNINVLLNGIDYTGRVVIKI